MLSAFLASGNIRKSKGPSEPMTKEEAKVRDDEIAAPEKESEEVMKKEWFEGLMKPVVASVNGCVCLCGR